MSAQHTPGRLTVKHMVGIYKTDGCLMASVHTPITQHGSENARRLVAAWNANIGVPTEMLEAMSDGPSSLLPMYARLEAQRDELLAALKTLHARYVQCIGNEGPEALAARAAIAKAGGAA